LRDRRAGSSDSRPRAAGGLRARWRQGAGWAGGAAAPRRNADRAEPATHPNKMSWADPKAPFRLTPTEQVYWELFQEGFEMKAIADGLGVSYIHVNRNINIAKQKMFIRQMKDKPENHSPITHKRAK